jgi:hypothetical protein
MTTKFSRAPLGLMLLLGTVVLAGCSPEISRGKQALEAKLKDPGSVQYKDVVAYSENVVCGEYNAKNELGGYVGFKRFITIKGSLVQGDEHANYMLLCDNERKNKVEVDAADLGHQDLMVVNAKSHEQRSWSARVYLWVKSGKKGDVWAIKEELLEVASQFLVKNDKGLSSWANNQYDPDQNRVTEQALRAELQKHLKDIEIKGVNLIAH